MAALDLLPSLAGGLSVPERYRSPVSSAPPSQEHVQQAPVSTSNEVEPSLEQLYAVLAERNAEVAELSAEIAELEQSPLEFDHRLQQLEQRFGDLQKGEVVKVKAPVLHSIAHSIKQNGVLARESAGAQPQDSSGEAAQQHFEERGYLKSQSLVLGRDYLSLDTSVHAKEVKEDVAKKDLHPLSHHVHFAGHLSKAVEEVEPVFVGAHGVARRPLRGASTGGFWLECFADLGSHAPVVAQGAPTRGRDHVAPQATAGKPGHFSAVLHRTHPTWAEATPPLGITCHPSIGETLFVESINGGMVEEWNRSNPASAMKAGDRILAVNGKSGDAQALVRDLENLLELEVHFFREDPLQKIITRHDEGGRGVDQFPTDWAGQVKRGEAEPEEKVQRRFVAPAWLY